VTILSLNIEEDDRIKNTIVNIIPSSEANME